MWMEELEGRVLLSAAVLDLSHPQVRRGTGEAEFQFEAEEGQTYLFFELEGCCSVHVTDEDGAQVAEEDPYYYRINWTAEESGTYYLWIDGDEDDPKGRYELLAEPFRDDFGDTPGTAGVLSADRAIHGEIEDYEDRDVFRFSAKEGERWAFEMEDDSEDGIYSELRNSRGHVLELGHGAQPMPYTGSYYVVISSSGGIGKYTLKARQVMDREGDQEHPTPLPLGKTFRGSTDFIWDEDWFSIDAVGGTTYTFDARSESEWDSMQVEIIDSEGNWPASPTIFNNGKGRVEWVAAADGQYYLRLVQEDHARYTISSAAAKPGDVFAEGASRNLAPGGSMSGNLASPGDVVYFAFHATEKATYEMHLTQSAMKAGLMISIFDSANINSGGQQGVLDGRSVEPLSPDWNWLAWSGGDYYVEMRSYNPVETGSFSISFEEELDEGNSAEEAAPIEVGAAVDGRSQYGGDEDWFSLQVNEGERYVFDMQGHGDGLGQWIHGHKRHYWQQISNYGLYDIDGKQISGSWNYPASTGKLEWTAPATETIYISVSAYPESPYTLLVNKAEDDPQPATPLKVGEVVSGRFEKQGESRRYRIALEPGKIYVTDVQLERGDSGISDLRAVEGSAMNGVRASGDAGEACHQRTWSVSEPVEYFVDLVSWKAGDFSAQIGEFDPSQCVAAQEAPEEPVIEEVDPATHGKLLNWRDEAVYWFRAQEGKSYNFSARLDKDEWVNLQLYGPDDQWMAYNEEEYGTGIIWKARKSGIYQLVLSAGGATGFDLTVRQRFSDRFIELSSKELTPRHHRIISDDEEEDDSQDQQGVISSDEVSAVDEGDDDWEEEDSLEDDWNLDDDVPDWWDASDWDV